MLNVTLSIYSKELKARTRKGCTHIFMAASVTIANTLKCSSVDEWLNKMLYTHSRNMIQSEKKREVNSDTCCNMDETCSHYAKWVK
jgi:hypothetical protein